MLEPLARPFFERDARIVARALIGQHLIRQGTRGGTDAVVRIVETEAYRGPKDAACHARFGKTARTKHLFGAPGRAYVFLIYGMYECFNVTCLAEDSGHAVLVRGVAPVTGMPEGARTDGPGRLTRALGITRAHDGIDLCDPKSPLLLTAPATTKRARVVTSARVGVAYAGEIADAPWRFFDPTSPYVSRPSPKTIGRGLSTSPK